MKKRKNWRHNYQYVGYSKAIIYNKEKKRFVPKVNIRVERSKRRPKEDKAIAKWWQGRKEQ